MELEEALTALAAANKQIQTLTTTVTELQAENNALRTALSTTTSSTHAHSTAVDVDVTESEMTGVLSSSSDSDDNPNTAPFPNSDEEERSSSNHDFDAFRNIITATSLTPPSSPPSSAHSHSAHSPSPSPTPRSIKQLRSEKSFRSSARKSSFERTIGTSARSLGTSFQISSLARLAATTTTSSSPTSSSPTPTPALTTATTSPSLSDRLSRLKHKNTTRAMSLARSPHFPQLVPSKRKLTLDLNIFMPQIDSQTNSLRRRRGSSRRSSVVSVTSTMSELSFSELSGPSGDMETSLDATSLDATSLDATSISTTGTAGGTPGGNHAPLTLPSPSASPSPSPSPTPQPRSASADATESSSSSSAPPISLFSSSSNLSLTSARDELDTESTREIRLENEVVAHVRVADGSLVFESATVDTLVAHLADESHPDTLYIEEFLLMFRLFMDPIQLMELLIARFNIQLPPNPSREDEEYYSEWAHPVRMRTVSVLSKWIERFWTIDFAPSPVLMDGLYDFLDLLASNPDFAVLHKHLDSKINSKANADLSASLPDLPGDLSLAELLGMDVAVLASASSSDIAAELTRTDVSLLLDVPPSEFITQLKGDPELAPHLSQYITRFNRVSRWVASMILYHTDIKPRRNMVVKFIHVVKKLKDASDYNSMMAVISGLNMICIERLDKTWAKVPSREKKALRKLEALLSPAKNYARYRAKLDTLKPPYVGFVGLVCKDLIVHHDTNPSHVSNAPHLVNYAKFRDMSSKVSAIVTAQRAAAEYTLKPISDDALADFVASLPAMDENGLYSLSLIVEPSERRRRRATVNLS